jgi:thioredoxin-like negative regulator of GroEL
MSLGTVSKSLAAAGDFERAEALARDIPDPEQRELALAALAEAVAAAGDFVRAEALVGSITFSDRRTAALTALVKIASGRVTRNRPGCSPARPRTWPSPASTVGWTC